VVGRSMGPFGEVSLDVERMISISGCFYEQGNSTGLVVIYRIAFVRSMVSQAEATCQYEQFRVRFINWGRALVRTVRRG